MNKLTIEDIWNQQDQPKNKRISIDEIKTFRRTLSSKIMNSRQRFILFDSITKVVVILGYIILLFLGGFTFLKSSLTVFVVLGGIYLIIKNKNLRSNINKLDSSKDVLSLLLDKYDTANQLYNEFTLIYAITNPFLVLCGFQFYQYFKYDEDRLQILLMDPVIYLFLSLAFLFSYIPQRVLYSKELKELEYILDVNKDESSLKIQMIRIKQRNKVFTIIFSLIALIGIVLLLTILFFL